MKQKTWWPKALDHKDRWESIRYPGEVYLNCVCNLRWVSVYGKKIDLVSGADGRVILGDE